MSSDMMRMNMKVNLLQDVELWFLNVVISLLSKPNPVHRVVCRFLSIACARRSFKTWVPWILTSLTAGMAFGMACSMFILN